MNNDLIFEIFNQIAPVSVTFALTFGIAEFLFKWFFRFIFGRYINSDNI